MSAILISCSARQGPMGCQRCGLLPPPLIEQLEPNSTAILCPLFTNAEPLDGPRSLRCHIWFIPRAMKHAAVSLLDVERESFLRLRELSTSEQLRTTVRLMLDAAACPVSIDRRPSRTKLGQRQFRALLEGPSRPSGGCSVAIVTIRPSASDSRH